MYLQEPDSVEDRRYQALLGRCLAPPGEAVMEPDGLELDDGARLAADLEQAGALVYRTDLSTCGDKANLMSRLAADCHFPEYFGGNWDALLDCWSDPPVSEEQPVIILVRGMESFARRRPELASMLLEVAADAAERLAEDDPPVAFRLVLLDG